MLKGQQWNVCAECEARRSAPRLARLIALRTQEEPTPHTRFLAPFDLDAVKEQVSIFAATNEENIWRMAADP